MKHLTSARLTLRPWRPDDWQLLHALHADAHVAQWLGGALTEEQAKASLAAICAQYAQGFGVHALWLDATCIGAAGLQTVRPGMPFCGVEATWRLKQSAQGKGYAEEAMRAVLADAHKRLGLNHVLTFTSRGNLQSQALMRRLGFVADPARDFDHPRLAADHPLRAHVYYEWRAG